MTPLTHDVTWGEGTVTVRVRGATGPTMLLAHGAGTDQDHPLVAGLAEALASHGLQVVTFNYPYSQAGRRAPDRAPRLLSCHRGVASWVRDEIDPDPFFAGRSMGGRMASMLAAEGEPMRGLVLFAYPLHPAGRPDRLRVEHLARISVPMVFVQGSRDRLAQAELFDRHVRVLDRVDVIELEGADHSWRVRGRPLDAVVAGVAEAVSEWVRRLATRPEGRA